MGDKTHEGIKVHEKEEGDDDLMWQPRCNIIDEESHPTLMNKAHWFSTALYSKMSWKCQNHIWILFNGGHGGGHVYQSIIKGTT
jgi:hypothetical protein